MNMTGVIVAVVGLIVLVVAVLNHFAGFFKNSFHFDLILGVVGLVILAVGGYMSMRKAA